MLQERDEKLAQEIEVSSAGLGRISKESLKFAKENIRYAFKSWLRRSPDKYVSAAMLKRGLDISKHRSKKLNRKLASEADLIITMEGKQRENILSRYPLAKGKVFTLKELAEEANSPDIRDPAGSSLKDFEACIGEIEVYLRKGMERILCHLK
jgi:protein-tyrosine-phosphatase